MRRREARAALAEQFLTQRSLGVGALVARAPNQFRYQQVDDILEISRRDRECDVQAIDIGLIDPCFNGIGDLFRPGPTFTNVTDFRAIVVDRK